MILVTGATGTVGRAVVRELQDAEVPFRALVRDVGRAREVLGRGVDCVTGDFGSPEMLGPALSGIQRVFLVAPLVPHLADLEGRLIDAAQRAGVTHLVKLSTLGVAQTAHGGDLAEPRQYPLHRRSEQRLEASGLAYTFLRPGPFMQNLMNFAPSIAKEGIFRGSWGNGRMGYVDVRDVAAAAARVLMEDGHQGRAYGLTGPHALSQGEVAEKLSAAVGRPVRYVDVPLEDVQRTLLARGVPEWFAGAMCEVMAHTRAGNADELADGVMKVIGKPPRSFDIFARDSAPNFRGGT